LKRFKERLTIRPSMGRSASRITRSEPSGQLRFRLQGRVVMMQHRACALVYHPGQSQVVSQPRRGQDRRGIHGGAEPEVPQARGRYRAHPARVPRGKGNINPPSFCRATRPDAHLPTPGNESLECMAGSLREPRNSGVFPWALPGTCLERLGFSLGIYAKKL